MRTMFRVVAVGALALGLGACSQDATGPVDQPQFAKNPKTLSTAAVSGPTLTVYVGGSFYYRTSGSGNNGVGSCLAGGVWKDGKLTSASVHPNCLAISGGTASATIGLSIKLTGSTLVSTVGSGWLWYHNGSNTTVGSNYFVSTDGVWTILAEQPLLNNEGNFLNPAGMPVLACSASGCQPAVMAW